jgi:hypothetical protein
MSDKPLPPGITPGKGTNPGRAGSNPTGYGTKGGNGSKK